MAWKNESRRHSLARRGIKTAQNVPMMHIKKRHLDEKESWKDFDKSEFRLEINRYTNNVSNFSFNNDFFARWWFEAFPRNRDPSYMHEWVDRFRKGSPTTFMDKDRLEAYIKVSRKWHTGFDKPEKYIHKIEKDNGLYYTRVYDKKGVLLDSISYGNKKDAEEMKKRNELNFK